MVTRDVNHRIKSGIIAGIAGGIVISAFMILLKVTQGGDAWMVTKGAGAPFLGERAAQPGFDLLAVVVGVACHFAVSIGWGVLFALLFHGASKELTVTLGAAWGLVVWLGMFFVVLPLLGLTNVAASVPLGTAIIEHVLFGLGVGLGYVPFQRPRTSIAVYTRPSP